jgi:hypothetical protein
VNIDGHHWQAEHSVWYARDSHRCGPAIAKKFIFQVFVIDKAHCYDHA